MSKPFEPFATEINYMQISLLLDMVSYFEEAHKLLSLPSAGGSVPVPLLPDSLRIMLNQVSEQNPTEKQKFSFEFIWTDEANKIGTVLVTLPSGEVHTQETNVSHFSAI